MQIEWIPLPEYEGYYEINCLGQICSIDRIISNCLGQQKCIQGKICTFIVDRHGYACVYLQRNNYSARKAVHRLVAQTFLPICKDKVIVHHKDGNKLNNSVENLEWTTHAENNKAAAYNPKTKRVREVYQLDKEGNIIAEFKSVTFAAIAVGTSASNISLACRGKHKTLKGFCWKYKEEDL